MINFSEEQPQALDLPFKAELAEFQSLQEVRDVLRAVIELRHQLHAKPVDPKKPFPGLRNLPKGTTASLFLHEQYGEEVAKGRIGPKDLMRLDMRLYSSLAEEAEAQGKTVGDYLKRGSREEVYERRRSAVANILNAPPEEAQSFLSALRDRRDAAAPRPGRPKGSHHNR